MIGEPKASPRLAATVVLIRLDPGGPEVLLIHRPTTMAFAADVHAFPGGALDPSDPSFEGAAIREVFEEVGVLLADPIAGAQVGPDALAAARAALLAGTTSLAEACAALGVSPAFESLVPISRWVTPPQLARRFDVRFFVAAMPDAAEAAFAEGEIAAQRWLTPRAALDAMAGGELAMWLPTSVTLQQLEHVRSIDDVRTLLAVDLDRSVARASAAEEVEPGIRRLVLGGAAGVPGQSVNAWLVGRRELVVVDPGDPSEEATDAIVSAASSGDGRIVGVALTHADPDHHAGGEHLREGLGVAVFAGPGAGRDLPYPVVELADGAAVPVGDIALRSVRLPGHRADHLGFDVLGRDIVISGDLVGEQASRAIVGPPDGPGWLASLDRLAAAPPRLLLPGHGEPIRDVSAAIDAERRRLLERQ